MNYEYSFNAVKGIQANKDYYICMVPLKLLSKLFFENDEVIEADFRAQRKINTTRIPNITDYILENRSSYVFSALTASIDGEFRFEESSMQGMGQLHISMDSTFLLNDGQHRKEAIINALKEDDSLKEETIPIVMFADAGLKQSQQMFTDLNKHAVNTSNSLGLLYEHKDKLTILTKKTVEEIQFLREYTDKEKDVLAKFSKCLFTLNNIVKANKEVFKNINESDFDEEFSINYWYSICNNIPEWTQLISGELTKKSLREDFITTNGVMLSALGKLGNYIILSEDKDLSCLSNLSKINFSRSSDNWRTRIFQNGKIVKNETNVKLTFIHLKRLLKLNITNEELQYENKILGGK
ncbi:MAG: DNA sulfur modification protein DndB [bacterium]